MNVIKQILGVLIAARELIKFEWQWVQFKMAKEAHGCVVGVDNLMACRFCSMGAIRRVVLARHTASGAVELEYWDQDVLYVGSINALTKHMPGGVNAFNDNHTYAEVVAAWDDVIQSVTNDVFKQKGEAQ